jgi:hypothetical protein
MKLNRISRAALTTSVALFACAIGVAAMSACSNRPVEEKESAVMQRVTCFSGGKLIYDDYSAEQVYLNSDGISYYDSTVEITADCVVEVVPKTDELLAKSTVRNY